MTLQVAAPLLFVLIWSTGFIVARAAAPHADLNIFLLLRFGLTALALGAAALAARAAWPKRGGFWPHIVAGSLMQGVYLCASYWAIANGLAVGAMALLGALQPLFTALLSVAIHRTSFRGRTWIGLATGFAGVALVLAPKLMSSGAGALSPLVVAAAFLSIVAVTIGTFVQKTSLAAADIRSSGCLQNIGGAIVAGALAATIGTGKWDGAPALWAALAWSVLATSVVGVTLLVWMVRKGEATKVTALLLLAPPLAAIEAYFLFGEILTPIQFVGFAMALIGVVVTRRG